MTDENLIDAVRLLGEYTHRFDPWELMGPANKRRRQDVMTALLNGPGGKRVPIAKCGVTAIRAEMFRRADIVAKCAAARESQFEEFCRELIAA